MDYPGQNEDISINSIKKYNIFFEIEIICLSVIGPSLGRPHHSINSRMIVTISLSLKFLHVMDSAHGVVTEIVSNDF